jgi:hypothetical protein
MLRRKNDRICKKSFGCQIVLPKMVEERVDFVDGGCGESPLPCGPIRKTKLPKGAPRQGQLAAPPMAIAGDD